MHHDEHYCGHYRRRRCRHCCCRCCWFWCLMLHWYRSVFTGQFLVDRSGAVWDVSTRLLPASVRRDVVSSVSTGNDNVETRHSPARPVSRSAVIDTLSHRDVLYQSMRPTNSDVSGNPTTLVFYPTLIFMDLADLRFNKVLDTVVFQSLIARVLSPYITNMPCFVTKSYVPQFIKCENVHWHVQEMLICWCYFVRCHCLQ